MTSREHATLAACMLLLAACRDESSSVSNSARTTATGALPDAATTPGHDIRFVVVGDTGTGTAAAQGVANAIAGRCRAAGCDFAMLLGDNVYDSGIDAPTDEMMVERFENVFAPVNIPFFPVLGNHDYGLNGLGTDFTKGENEILYSRRSAKWKMPDAFYTMSFGVLDIFALDTNLAYFERAPEQSAKMKAAMQRSHARWKIAYGHHPYMSNGVHGNAGHYNGVSYPPAFSGENVKTFVEETVCGNVDVYMAGHDHTMQWLTSTCSGTELLVDGAGAKTTSLPGKNESRFQSLSLGFVYGVATERSLKLEFVDDAGRLLFSRTLEKP